MWPWQDGGWFLLLPSTRTRRLTKGSWGLMDSRPAGSTKPGGRPCTRHLLRGTRHLLRGARGRHPEPSPRATWLPSAPQTPAPQRLSHEVLPGLPLPANQQHQARDASLRSHRAASPPPSRIPPALGPTGAATAQPQRGPPTDTPPAAARRRRAWLRRKGAPSRSSLGTAGPAQSLTSPGHNHSPSRG